MSKHKQNLIAANEIVKFLAKAFSYDVMNDFENKYAELIDEYNHQPDLIILSTIKTDGLASYKKWVQDAMASKHTVIPLLISKMLEGDIFALNIYDNLQEALGQPELIIDYYKIHTIPALKEQFKSFGGAEDARAIVTAENWLQSSEAVDLLGQTEHGIDNLCSVCSVLNFNNQFTHC